jgi:hypothetical protein
MFESFLNPGYLLAGAALISLPIIIHLINRMRYKRVKWAAMEFLLKSQKRNRRRLIIEQLILLALRCLLVLLAVILVSRYLGFALTFEQNNTVHVVLLDDSLSMTDHWKEEGEDKDCFKIAKELIIKDIAKNAVQARTAQQLVLLYLSEPNVSHFDQRLNDQTVQDLQRFLAEAKCTALRLNLTNGVEAAKAVFDKTPQDKHLLHIVSDFRQRDWSEPDVASLRNVLDSLNRASVQINLVDAAHPYRNDLQKTPLFHDNLGIVELRPETRVAAKDRVLPFTVTVANYGTSERKNVRVAIKVNGGERLEASVTLSSVPAGGPKSETFQLLFTEQGFHQVTANLENEETGLQADNVRYVVIDVRNQVPVLLIDGDLTNGLKPGGDTFHIQTVLSAAKGYQASVRGVNELEQPNLDQYACIYLMNVRDLSDKGLKNLEAYIRDGGSVAFFVGDKVNPEYYTKTLYAKGTGIFPAPLAEKPFPALSDPDLEPDLFDQQPKIYVRIEDHPIFAEVWQPRFRGIFNFLPIRRYYPVPRRLWEKTPGKVEELVTLPNHRPLRDYQGAAQEILAALEVAANDPKADKYRPGLQRHQAAIRATLLGDKPLYELANALEALLKDRGEPNDPNKPSMVEFWNQSEYQKLHARIEQFREEVLLGDPLVITQVYGKGRVIAFLTTAGRGWSDWAGGSLATPTYPVVMLELQKYLTSSGAETQLTVGSPLEIQLDSSRFDNKIHRYFQPESRDAPAGAARGAEAGKSTGLEDLKEQAGAATAGKVTFVFNEARKPGMYLFDLTRKDESNPAAPPKTEQRAYAFNVDAAESDLRRAAKDDLEKMAPGAKVRYVNSGWATELSNRRNDLSESAWFYLAFLVILVIEQALAVHLSFHLKGSENVTPVQAPRPQPTAA